MPDKQRTQGEGPVAGAHQPLADLAGRQHGVVSSGQLQDLGYSRDAISWAARSGRLQRLHRGVYAVGHRSLTWHSHCLAAVLACGPNSFASHTSAAWLWGLLPSRPGAIHITALTRRHRRSWMRLHYARLAPDDCAVREEIPVTSLARTLLDLAPSFSPPRLDRVIERAEERDLFDLRAVVDLLDRVGGHAGAARLRRAVAIYRSEPAFARSHLELRFRDLIRSAGVPEPALNYNVAGFELDAYWEAERFAVELDVYETHGSRRAFEADRLRQEELKLMGVKSVRVTGARLDREPDRVIARVASLLKRRRKELAAQRVRRGSIRSAQ